MIAAKQMDPVMGVDIHIVQPPGPVPPVPIPHPFIGMVMDPIDCMPMVGATVMVNGMPRATAGTGCKNIPPHIPIGGTFIKPPGNEGEVFMGSATVLADGSPLSFMAVPVLSCSDVGMPPPPRPTKKGSPSSLMLPTTVLMAVPMGQLVMVGGPPTIDMMGMAMKVGMAGLGKAFKKLKKTKVMKKASDKMHSAAEGAMKKMGVPPSARNKVHRGICSVTGHPVDIASGKVFTEQVDFEIPGPIPLKWERIWYSTSVYDGPLGRGWHHGYDMALIEDKTAGAVAIRMADGRSVAFPILEPGENYFSRQDKLTLYRDEEGYYLRDTNRLYYRFSPVIADDPETQLLTRIENGPGFAIRLVYDTTGFLSEITDSAGRIFKVSNDESGRITAIHAPHPDKEGQTFPIMRYEYDWDGDLIKAYDALDHFYEFEYQNHLLIREANRNGLNFYFEYDGIGQDARCVHTWGDGGIYDHKLTYAGGLTVVENSLGHSTSHFHDGSVVHKMVDAMGGAHYTVYNEFYDVVEEIDSLGRKRVYQYDDRGNCTMISFPDETNIQMVYEDDLIVLSVDQNGGQWKWKYNEYGAVIERTDCENGVQRYEYQDGLLSKLTVADEKDIQLKYDLRYHIVSLTTPDKHTHHWNYDQLGRTIVSTDIKSNTQYQSYNLRGDLVKVEESDRNQRNFTYNPEGALIEAQDTYHHVTFEYQGMNRLKARMENGTRVEIYYDTEEQLIGIKNEQGQLHQIERDPLGNIELESGYDGINKFYKRDSEGQIQSILRASGIESTFEYDPMGRILKVQHSNGEWEKLSYRADGKLASAINPSGEVYFERDLLGRILSEIQGEYSVSSTYDILGNRSELRSSLGAKVDYTRDIMGNIVEMRAKGGSFTDLDGISQDQSRSDPFWQISFERDEAGLELLRKLPGELKSTWTRDYIGRPVRHETLSPLEKSRSKTYAWDIDNRLHQIQDSQLGTTRFEYDAFGNLSVATYGDGSFEYRMPDENGNLFKSHNRNDRIYGPAGNLIKSVDARYEYDQEGNLLKKIDQNGEIWHYEWNAVGLLKQVIRPDSQTVTFTYDALGRRLTKTFNGETTRWIWDGNIPLHEWIEKELPTIIQSKAIKIKKHEPSEQTKTLPTSKTGWETQHVDVTELITWIFEGERFSPIAKLVGDKSYSIVNDHLGSPQSMYDEQGRMVWFAEFSIYGELRTIEGIKTQCPFRYPGQYEDAEIGLYYNRFRYYDPQTGTYLSKDPIGIKGNNPNLYAYVHNVNILTDVLGLAEMVDPKTLNFSQGYVTGETSAYEQAMKDGDWDWNKFPDDHATPSALRVVEVEGELVSLDNRRLLAAQNAGIEEVPIIKVGENDPMPGGGTYGRNLEKKLNSKPKNRPDLPKIKLPPTGTKTKPKVVPCK